MWMKIALHISQIKDISKITTRNTEENMKDNNTPGVWREQESSLNTWLTHIIRFFVEIPVKLCGVGRKRFWLDYGLPNQTGTKKVSLHESHFLHKILAGFEKHVWL